MTFVHTGRVATFTGAGSGIGRATAARLAAEGAPVAVLDVAADRVKETVAAIVEDGGEAAAFRADVLIPRFGEPEDVAAAISFLLSDDASYITGAPLSSVDGGWLAT